MTCENGGVRPSSPCPVILAGSRIRTYNQMGGCLRRHRSHPNSRRRNNEQGVVILLVAVVMLFVVGAMAALSIDVVTLYTARSEAQVAADSAALAGARVLANSGATSDTTGTTSMGNAWNLAKAVAIQVAEQNKVAGTNLTDAEVTLPGTG